MELTDSTVHDIDIARFLLDDEPAAISVKVPRTNSRGGTLSDPLITLIEMRGGALVAIETSVNIAYGYDIRGEVVGETGTVALADTSAAVLRSRGVFSGRVPVDWRACSRPRSTPSSEPAAGKGGAAGSSAWDGYVATVVTSAGVRAMQTGTPEPIRLRDPPALYSG